MVDSVIQPSFSAGELSQTLYGRVDLAKYKVGLALCRNFFVDYRGGISNRAGTKFVGYAMYADQDSRLIPFKFNTEQTYILEFGNLLMRVIKDGEYVVEAAKTIISITLANPALITSTAHGFSNGDWVYFSVGGMTELNQQTWIVANATADTFTLVDYLGNAIDSSAYTPFTSGTVARVYSLATPYVSTDLALLKYTQSADVLTLFHPDYATRDLTRTGHASWTLTEIAFVATIDPPANISGTSSGAGAARFSYTVTAISENGEESIAGTPDQFSGVNISTTSGTNTITWDPVDGAAYYNVYRTTISPAADIPVGANHGYVGMTYGLQFLDTNITPDFTKTPPLYQNPFAVKPITAVQVTAGGAGYVASTTTVTVTDGTGSGAEITPIVVGGAVVGAVILNGGENYTSPTLSVVGAGAGATLTATLGPSTGTYPSTGCYFQQRKYFACSDNYPQTIWATQPGAFTNMGKSIPTVDSDAINLTLASTQVNDIKWMLPMPGGLVVLTGSGAWQVTGTGGQNTAVTPTSAIAVPQAYNGCADLPPIVVNYDILYVQNKGSIVRDLNYNFFTNIYTGIDVSALSNHLFNPYTLLEWAYAEEPHKVVWVVRNDGKLLSLTFIKEQEVIGWAQHDTQGEFKSVAVIQEDNEDVAYFVVKRYVDGQWFQFIEKMAPRYLDENVADELKPESAWFLDCALQYPINNPAADLTLSGVTGTITVTASASVFTAGDVGKILRAGGGRGVVASYVSGTEITVTLDVDVILTIPNDDGDVPLPVLSGEWSLQTEVTTVTGLNHLEGKEVSAVADGNPVTGLTVTNGAVTLPQAASMILVGLPYKSQAKTLYLDLNADGGTVQGKRKRIAALTIRVANSRGLSAGADFDNLIDIKMELPTGYGYPYELVTGDMRLVMDPRYDVPGQVCIEQATPMPATVLAVIPEIVMGDTP